jgi:hypothetical protein
MATAAALLAVALATGLPRRVTLVLNLDPVPYPAASSGQPGAPAQEAAIPAARMLGQELSPGVAIREWEVGFVCTARGWRRVHGAALLFWGHAIGSSVPPEGWVPPHSC